MAAKFVDCLTLTCNEKRACVLAFPNSMIGIIGVSGRRLFCQMTTSVCSCASRASRPRVLLDGVRCGRCGSFARCSASALRQMWDSQVAAECGEEFLVMGDISNSAAMMSVSTAEPKLS
jgi:hypothetical protein